MKFIVDRMLGKLAKQLRMLGYDTLYYRGEDVYPLIRLGRQEGRVILTRNTKLIPRRPEDVILRITEDEPLLQLKELIQKGNIEMDEGKALLQVPPLQRPSRSNISEGGRGKGSGFHFSSAERILSMPSMPENLLARVSSGEHATEEEL